MPSMVFHIRRLGYLVTKEVHRVDQVDRENPAKMVLVAEAILEGMVEMTVRTVRTVQIVDVHPINQMTQTPELLAAEGVEVEVEVVAGKEE